MRFAEPITEKVFFSEAKDVLAAMAGAGLEHPRFTYAERDNGDAVVGFTGDVDGRPRECTVLARKDQEAQAVLGLLRFAGREFIKQSA